MASWDNSSTPIRKSCIFVMFFSKSSNFTSTVKCNHCRCNKADCHVMNSRFLWMFSLEHFSVHYFSTHALHYCNVPIFQCVNRHFLLAHYISPFKHVKDKTGHQSARFENRWPPFCKKCFKKSLTWSCKSRQRDTNFKWVKILIE